MTKAQLLKLLQVNIKIKNIKENLIKNNILLIMFLLHNLL